MVHGTWRDGFAEVRDVLAANLESGLDVGASVAVYLDGEPAVDVWGGYEDAARTRPWRRDTVTTVWSVTKTMTALCALILADRGALRLDAPVARYWPEFAAAGKDGVEVRHLLGHTAGLPDWDEPLAVEDLYDWDKATALLARQAPWWTPGTASGYHALTQGYLVGEVVRRVCGRSIGTFFAEEVAGPLGADFHLTLGPEQDHRFAPIIPRERSASAAAPPPPVPLRTIVTPEDSWRAGWRRAEIPAVAGYGNARSVAAVQSVLAGGGAAGGRRLLSEAGARATLSVQADGVDLVLGAPLRFGVGYGLNSTDIDLLPNPDTCWWDGWGGSVVVADLDARMCVAYVMNRMRAREYVIGDRRGTSVIAAAYRALGTR
ncbi:serine hydrolase domain-containing protein [Amycolatopsis arida]|nr:serine hydrolase domain-containing protein [Amycolatopsis arida]